MSNQIPLPGHTPTVGEYTFEEFLQAVESFHGYTAQGVVISGIMVDFAMQQLPEGILV